MSHSPFHYSFIPLYLIFLFLSLFSHFFTSLYYLSLRYFILSISRFYLISLLSFYLYYHVSLSLIYLISLHLISLSLSVAMPFSLTLFFLYLISFNSLYDLSPYFFSLPSPILIIVLKNIDTVKKINKQR